MIKIKKHERPEHGLFRRDLYFLDEFFHYTVMDWAGSLSDYQESPKTSIKHRVSLTEITE